MKCAVAVLLTTGTLSGESSSVPRHIRIEMRGMIGSLVDMAYFGHCKSFCFCFTELSQCFYAISMERSQGGGMGGEGDFKIAFTSPVHLTTPIPLYFFIPYLNHYYCSPPRRLSFFSLPSLCKRLKTCLRTHVRFDDTCLTVRKGHVPHTNQVGVQRNDVLCQHHIELIVKLLLNLWKHNGQAPPTLPSSC